MGYDWTDHTDVAEDYFGTMEDVRELLEEMDSRGQYYITTTTEGMGKISINSLFLFNIRLPGA